MNFFVVVTDYDWFLLHASELKVAPLINEIYAPFGPQGAASKSQRCLSVFANEVA